jgi:hypothetical protein
VAATGRPIRFPFSVPANGPLTLIRPLSFTENGKRKTAFFGFQGSRRAGLNRLWRDDNLGGCKACAREGQGSRHNSCQLSAGSTQIKQKSENLKLKNAHK